ncbi:MAG TPA: winged helix-turn-helix domain-containing protein [Methanothrix sp.]|nr:winged helix-turn-helix domain-containing protein [Methanothrix sp.]
MNTSTIESLFGTNAGVVWRSLNQNGPSNIRNLVKTTSLSREEVFGALGWLGRENKLVMAQKGRAMVFSLRGEEGGLILDDEINIEHAPKPRSKHRKANQPKKNGMIRSVKSPAKPTESPAKEPDRMAEYLLH